MAQIFAKVAVLGKQVQEYYLEEGTTVGQLLEQAEIEILEAGEGVERATEIRVNNRLTAVAEALQDGDLVTVMPGIKGG